MKKLVGFVSADENLSKEEQLKMMVDEVMQLLEKAGVLDESEEEE